MFNVQIYCNAAMLICTIHKLFFFGKGNSPSRRIGEWRSSSTHS